MAADKGPLHQFEISNLYEIRLDNIDISFTNSALSMVYIYFGSKCNFLSWIWKKPKYS